MKLPFGACVHLSVRVVSPIPVQAQGRLERTFQLFLSVLAASPAPGLRPPRPASRRERRPSRVEASRGRAGGRLSDSILGCDGGDCVHPLSCSFLPPRLPLGATTWAGKPGRGTRAPGVLQETARPALPSAAVSPAAATHASTAADRTCSASAGSIYNNDPLCYFIYVLWLE